MAGDRPVSDVLQDVLKNLQELVHSEVQLLKVEVREDATRALSGATWLGLGAINVCLAWMMLLWAAVFALAPVMPLWGATLVVSGFTAAVAVMLLVLGRRRLQRLRPQPERTIQTMKENLEWIKQSTK
jgi:hypothetical protein